MKPSVERELNTKLTVNGSAALDQFNFRGVDGTRWGR